MANYVIGVDGGATKSHLALFSTDGTLVDFRAWGPMNHEALPGSFAQLENEMTAFFGAAFAANGIGHGDIAHAVFGMAGVDTQAQHGIISAMLRRQGFDDFTLCNDAYLGIPAGIPGGVGICAINGTGATLAGIGPGGDMLQIGGIGPLSGDLGGGGLLGQRVAGAVYTHIYRKGPRTMLTPMMFEAVGLADKGEYMEKVGLLDYGAISGLNRLLFSAAEQGDAVAAGILADCADHYAGAIATMLEELRFGPETMVVLAGSVFVKEESPVLVGMLKEKTAALCPKAAVRFSVLASPPVAGAVAWALRAATGSDMLDRLLPQLRAAGQKT